MFTDIVIIKTIKKFNPTFQAPKVDTSGTRDSLSLKLKMGMHLQNDEKYAKNSGAYIVTFDLQLQIYILKCIIHNFGIHDSVTDVGCICLWTDNYGGRGP